ncbi:MAG: exonuclease subunit SbcD [Micromonosporaceae bacterium]|nr:exonuclease subunit SbcD [Micromonosporaceae bacterium]
MKILHTSDWHVGKVLKGQPRAEEQIAALAEIVQIAQAEQPDLVIVAGDLYENAAPAPESTRIVTRALSALRRTGAEVIAIAGNHDNGAAMDALRGWAEAAGITVRGTVRHAEDHLITGVTAGGEAWRCVALPFLSQRYAVRATEMFDLTGAEANQTYADHLQRMLGVLTEDFDGTAVNLITAHLTVVGATAGGGEREAHTIQAYAVPATLFPASAHYVALGHLHRRQAVNAPCPVHYSGSPVAVDFGEEENSPGVLLVEVAADTPAKVREIAVNATRPLRTVRGTLEELTALRTGEAWLRVYVRESPRAGLREEVQELLPRALEVRIDPDVLPDGEDGAPRARRAGRSPRDLFAAYLEEKGHDDPAVRELFDQLYAEVDQ